MFGLAFGMIQRLRNDINLHCMYRPPFNAKMLEGTLRRSPKIERQQSVNDFWSCIQHNHRDVGLLYGGVRSSSQVCAGVCDGG